MSSKRYLAEDEPPTKKLISEGDLLIKELVKKQQNTEIKLHLQLSSTKQFEKSSDVLPLSHILAGECSSKKFTEISKNITDLEELRFAGLNSYDIQLYSDYNQGIQYFMNKHKTSEKNILFERINVIIAKITEYQELKLIRTECTDVHNRSENETLLSVKPTSKETQLLKFALNNKKNVADKIPHPLDHVKKLNDDLFGHLTDQISVNKIRRKARKLANRINGSTSNTVITKLNGNHSKWDQIETDAVEPTKLIAEKKIYKCNALNYYTVKDGEIVKLGTKQKNLSFDGKKMNYEDIIKIPKFEKYKIGAPSKVIYIKNLSAKITEQDLRILFDKFNTRNDLGFKVMTGRMKGQAFITFLDENLANDALTELNGLLVDDKPILMEFGKGK